MAAYTDADGQIAGINVHFLVDNGATVSLLSTDKFGEIESSQRPKLDHRPLKIAMAVGRGLQIVGMFKTNIGIGQSEIPTTVQIPGEGVLGMNFMKTANCEIDLHNLSLKHSSHVDSSVHSLIRHRGHHDRCRMLSRKCLPFRST